MFLVMYVKDTGEQLIVDEELHFGDGVMCADRPNFKVGDSFAYKSYRGFVNKVLEKGPVKYFSRCHNMNEKYADLIVVEVANSPHKNGKR